MSKTRWWQGSRGEWYLVMQAAIFLLIVLGPREWQGVAGWSPSWISRVAGIILMVAGLLLAAAGAVTLGKDLTPLPRPGENISLIVTGPYRIVRHPIYSGLIAMALGWGLWLHSWLTMGYALLLFIFFDLKARREERWLEEKFPEYEAYRSRTRKLVPFIY